MTKFEEHHAMEEILKLKKYGFTHVTDNAKLILTDSEANKKNAIFTEDNENVRWQATSWIDDEGIYLVLNLLRKCDKTDGSIPRCNYLDMWSNCIYTFTGDRKFADEAIFQLPRLREKEWFDSDCGKFSVDFFHFNDATDNSLLCLGINKYFK